MLFSKKKYVFFQENYKHDQNGLIHPENWRLLFFIIGGVRVEIPAVNQTFWLPLFPQKHFKRSIFNVIAKFGDYKYNKDIKKIVEKNVFFHRRGVGKI